MYVLLAVLHVHTWQLWGASTIRGLASPLRCKVGSYALTMTVPLALQMSESKFSALGALGAGLLTGTALAVILPEGFHAFQAAQDATGLHCSSLEHPLPAAPCSGLQ